MAQGYWQPGASREFFCRCCKSGAKQKYFCMACDHVIKAPWSGSPLCPFCRQPMLAMGDKWRPGRKGRRSLEHSHQSPARLGPRMSDGERLLLTLERSAMWHRKSSGRNRKRRERRPGRLR